MADNNLNFMNTILVEDTPRNKFDLSHDVKLSFDMGELIPTAVIEVVPGDRFEMKQDFMIRFAPMIAPVMNRFKCYTHFFFVPNRILIDGNGWAKFITQSPLKKGLPIPELPYVNLQGKEIPIGSNGDYLGIPTTATGETYPDETIKINALPIAGLLKIYDDYYRDQDLIDELLDEDGLAEGDNTDTLMDYLVGKPLKRARKLDYFTAARPWPQGNIEQITIPITGEANIEYDATELGLEFVTRVRDPLATGHPYVGAGDLKNIDAGLVQSDPAVGDPQVIAFDNSMVLKAQLSDSVVSTINDFRKAWAFQQFYELNGRAGTRLPEWTWAHFGVKTDDASLQRPQYLGGGAQDVRIEDVTQTMPNLENGFTDEVTPAGTKAGEGWAIGESSYVDKEFNEHGFIFAITSMMPEVTYMQGLPKHWSKLDPFDYYVPSLAEVGEQPVYTKELYFTGDPAIDNDIFGYLPPFSEYRTMLNRVCGDFRETLLYWHLADIYDEQPLLGKEFIEQGSEETKRIFAVQDIPQSDGPAGSVRNWNVLYGHIFNKIEASRKIPMFGTPAKLV